MKKIFLFINQQKYGPYNLNEIESFVKQNRADTNTLCWQDGMAQWQNLGERFPQLFVSPPPVQSNNVNYTENPPTLNKKKKSGCFSCLAGCFTIILIILGIFLSIWGYNYFKNKKIAENKENEQISLENTQYKTIFNEDILFNKYELAMVKTRNTDISVFNFENRNKQKLQIKEIKGIKLKKGLLLSTPVEIELEDNESDNFPIEIIFKNIRKILKSNDSFYCISISENGDMNYPYIFETDNGKAISVLSTHLTGFVPAKNSKRFQYSKTMTIPNNMIYSRIRLNNNQVTNIMNNYKSDIKYIPASASGDFWKIFNEHFGIATNITGFAENAMYLEGFSNFNKYIPEVGLSLAFVQLGIDLYNGDEKSAALNLTKNSGYYGIAKGFPTRAMNVAMVGVFVIDYSINKFGESALQNRKELYLKIGSKWLQRRRNSGQDGKWWHKRLKKVIDTYKEKPEYIGRGIERSFELYVAELWENDSEINFLQGELGQTGFTSLGGMNESLRIELSEALKESVKQYCKPVIGKLTKDYLIKQQNYARDMLKKSVNYLNRKNTIKIVAKSEKGGKTESLKGMEVGILIKNRRFQKQWSTELTEDGEAQLKCTNLGFINAGIPHTAYIKIPIEGEKPLILKKKFKLKQGKTIVNFIINTDDLTGDWEGNFQITENTYFESMMKAAVFVFKAVGMNEKEASKKLAMAKSVFQEPKGLKRKRYLKMTFKPIKDLEKYSVKVIAEGDSGRKSYSGSAKVKKGQFYYEMTDKTGSIHFKGTIVSPNNLVGTFAIGTKGFYAAKGKWQIKRLK